MLRAIAVWMIPLAAVAQQTPPPEPFAAAQNAYGKAHSEGRFEDAARHREEARRLLAKVPSDAPQLAGWAANLAEIYSSAGMIIDARSILEETLDRVPTGIGRVLLLTRLSELWDQDKHLLKSLFYREKAVEAIESIKIPRTTAPSREALPRAEAHQRLAQLYQRLGRPDAVAVTRAKMNALAKDDDTRLAQTAEQEGRTDEAAAIYKRIAEQAAARSSIEPWPTLSALQSLARVYERDSRYADAVAAWRQAVAVVESSADPNFRNHAVVMRLQLATALKQAGDLETAEQVHQQIVADATPDMRFGAMAAYANFLGATERAPQGLQLMQDYLGRGAPQGEASMALMTLAQLARRAGESKLADEYQKSAMAKQPARTEEQDRILIAPYFQKAQSAANAGRVDEGFALTMEVMSAAWNATDRNRIVGFVASVATALANRTLRDPEAYEKASEKAAQLFDRLFTLVESWNGQTRQPLLDARELYVRFLMHPDRRDKADDAIARYREAIIAARGEGSGWLEKVLQLKLLLADQSNQPERRVELARDLVQLEQSLSGKTSDAYMRAVQMLANIYQNGGDPERALPLFMQVVAISDLVSDIGDSQRGYTRSQAAYTLARLGRFDEAEKLIDEAVAIKLRPPQPNLFRSQAEEIQRMKLAAQRPK
jgi:hypothetical protein